MLNLKIDQMTKNKKHDPIKIFNGLKGKLNKVVKLIEHHKKGTILNNVWNVNIKKNDSLMVNDVMKHVVLLKAFELKNILVIGSNKLLSSAKNLLKTLADFKDPGINFYYANDLNNHIFVNLKNKLEKLDNFLIIILSSHNEEVKNQIHLWNAYKILVNKVGEEKANSQIMLVAKAKSYYFHELAKQYGWKTIIVDNLVTDKFGLTSPFGLLPLAMGGINIKKLLVGVNDANKAFEKNDILQNKGIQYALIREFFTKLNKFELISVYNEQLLPLANLLKEIFNDYENQSKIMGSYKNCLTFTNLRTQNNFLKNHPNLFFETLISIKKDSESETIENPFINSEKINLPQSFKLGDINHIFEKNIKTECFKKQGIETIEVEIETINEQSIGYLYTWFINSYIFNSLLNKINPFKDIYNHEFYLKINSDLAKYQKSGFFNNELEKPIDDTLNDDKSKLDLTQAKKSFNLSEPLKIEAEENSDSDGNEN